MEKYGKMAELILDVRGLACPLPLLKAQQALRKLQPQDILCVVTTDPRAPDDFRAFSKQTQHELLKIIQDNSETKIWIRKKA